MAKAVDWPKAVQPLLKKYKKLKHPLEHQNTFQLMVMVILSAQDSDKHINNIAPEFFKLFPDLKALAKSTPSKLTAQLSSVRNHKNKISWLLAMAREIKKESNIDLSMESLVSLPGIGRKSANVIRREAGLGAEGIMVDLHTVRVAIRLGIADTVNPKKIEEYLMQLLPRKLWDIGMCLSFHGREICRPTPICENCFMREVCDYYKKLISH